MLHEFLSANRAELIRRCRSRVGARSSPPVTPLELEHGIPRFLEQLVDALRHEEANPESWSEDRKSTRLNSSHSQISYAVFCLKKKKKTKTKLQNKITKNIKI